MIRIIKHGPNYIHKLKYGSNGYINVYRYTRELFLFIIPYWKNHGYIMDMAPINSAEDMRNILYNEYCDYEAEQAQRACVKMDAIAKMKEI